MSPKLEVLHVPDCPNLAPMLDRLRQATDLAVTTREISSAAEAASAGMAGSPTLLINGIDPFATQSQSAFAVSCRLYRDEQGRIVTGPSVEQLREAITSSATGSRAAAPGEVLRAWRIRALPLDPAEKATHQAILRTFATTGQPPAPSAWDRVIVDPDRSTDEVLAALHEVDAIRLAADGSIAVAYPFSSTPTRHHVRIGDRVDVYAMCALDALGIAAMLGEETRIESVDVTSGLPVTVTMTGNDTTWEPTGAVVFIGADAGDGPSADSCCDYVNFFIDATTAKAWTATHPHVPGQILDQREAEDLGACLFGPLLAS